MRRSDRESTYKKSELLKSKLASREKEKSYRKALKSSTSHDIVDLPDGNDLEVVPSDKNTSEGEVFASDSDEYWIDTSAQELSGTSLTSPVSPFPAPLTDPERWSVSINRVSEPNLADSLNLSGLPLLEDLPVAGPSVISNKTSSTQDKPVVELAVDTLSQPDHNSSSSSNSSIVTVTRKNMAIAMDNDEYYAHTLDLDNHIFDVDSLISRFNKDTVDLLDLGSYKDELQTIFNKLGAFEKVYLTVKNKLDHRIPENAPKLEKIKNMYQAIQKRVIDNEVAVKKKLRELQAADTTIRSPPSIGTVSSGDSTADGRLKEKVELKIKHATKKFKDLTKVVNDLDEVSAMTEHTIRDSLVESKDWRKDLKTFRDLKESVDLEMLSVDIEEGVQTELQEVYEAMVTSVTKKIDDLNKADKDLGLFALSESKSKSSFSTLIHSQVP